ncbi:MAG TPA: hypothetical protein VLL52_06005 [Anaerolineae bacterium]|nr:hypothetical protein [Anaerolineae bacterium]
MKITFEYCSLHYLKQWLKDDKPIVQTMRQGTRQEKLKALNTFINFYQVARNFPRACDIELGKARYEPVLDIIDPLTADDFKDGDLATNIQSVADQISAQYNGKGVLSATTKVLWTKVQAPVVIYDSRVRKALGSPTGNLPKFLNKWQAQYQQHENQVHAACLMLPKLATGEIAPNAATPDYIESIATQDWFKQRVFDIYLWHIGG